MAASAQKLPWIKKSYTNNHLRFGLHERRSFVVSLVKRRCERVVGKRIEPFLW